MATRSPLEAVVREAIRREGPLPFDRFMELALYHEPLGYFARSDARVGTGGDFWTAPEISPLFGACVHAWVSRVADRLGHEGFHLVELGAGRGTLATELLRHAPPAWQVHLVERAGAPRASLERAFARDPRVRVHADVAGLPRRFRGAVVGNEVLDNVPVRRLMRADGWQEIRVGLERGRLRETLHPAPPDLVEAAQAAGLRLEPGQVAEVAPAAAALLEDVLARLEDGAFLLFDYGGEAQEVSGEAAPQGTLAAHRGHARTADLLAAVGEQDLTHDVNFTPLVAAARRLGFEVTLGDQAGFLLEHGLAERLVARLHEETDPMERLRLNQRAKQLYHPEAMGESFRAFQGRRPAATHRPVTP